MLGIYIWQHNIGNVFYSTFIRVVLFTFLKIFSTFFTSMVYMTIYDKLLSQIPYFINLEKYLYYYCWHNSIDYVSENVFKNVAHFCFMDSKNKSIGDTLTSFERQLIRRRKRLEKKAKTVRFEDHLDDAASGYVGGLRRKFKAEDQRSRLKKEVSVHFTCC